MFAFLVCLWYTTLSIDIPFSVPEEHINEYRRQQHETIRSKRYPNPCASKPGIDMAFCDYSLSFESRAWSLLDNLTINETLSQTSCWAGPINRLNMPLFGWWVDAAHGLGQHVNFASFPTKSSTQFPQIINSGATFNRTLWWQIGDVISTEGRAFSNYGSSSLTYWDPNINIFRDPRWGRGQEVPGEDPFVNAQYGINFVKGMQGDHPKYLKSAVTCKHFDAYSLEGSWGPDHITRQTFNAIVSDYDFNQTYYPPFKYCVSPHPDHGKASGVMCSYNEVNGVPSCANKQLLTTMLNEWGFDGYVVSDCWAVSQVQKTHHYTNNSADTINAVYDAGLNLECANFIEYSAWDAIQKGKVNFQQIKNQTVNAIKVMMRLGYFDPPEDLPWNTYNESNVNTPYNQQVALEVARQSTVLLKNENYSFLPLRVQNVKSVAVLGPNANDSEVLLGNYQGIPPFIITPLDAIESYLDNTTQTLYYDPGCEIHSNDTTHFAQSIAYAKEADVTVLVMGLNNTIEAEGLDRHSLYLPGVQNEFIRNISSVTDNIILILINAGCVDVLEFKNNDHIKAILWAGYGGMYGGLGAVDVVFGAFNPTGLVSQTWYLGGYVDEVEMTNMNMRPNTTSYPGRGYRYYNGKSVLYEFGFGLSYTRFECRNLTVRHTYARVSVANIGTMHDSGGVVLLYWIPNEYNIEGPIKRLVGFERFNMLKVGEEMNIDMDLYEEFYFSKEYQQDVGYFKLGGVCDQTASDTY
eukprot:253753_1